MALRFKDSVRFGSLQPQMFVALMVVQEEFDKLGVDTWITSVNDSTHMVNSKHYSGKAFDFRTHHITRAQVEQLEHNLKNRIGKLGFTVLVEDYGEANEHGHVQYSL